MSDQKVKLQEVESSSQMGGHLLVECLIAQGVTHAFGVPGEATWLLSMVFTSTKTEFSLSPAGKRAGLPSWPMHKAV